MLLRFVFRNFRSYKDNVDFSLLCPGGKIKKRYPNNFESLCGADILKTGVIIGENAGGKSNFVKALEYLKALFGVSDRPITSAPNTIFSKNRAVPSGTEPFEGEALKASEQLFEVECIVDGLIYTYKLIIDAAGIESESLSYRAKYSLPEKPVFRLLRERFDVTADRKNIEATHNIQLFSGSEKERQFIIDRLENTFGNGLLINSLSLLNVPNTTPFVKWVNDTLGTYAVALPLNFYFIVSNIETNDILPIMKTVEFAEIFKLVDSSIKRIEIDDEKPFENTVVYRVSDGKEWPRRISDDSSGVKQFFALSYYVYQVIYLKKVFFVDELDSMLNPILTMKLVNFIHSFPSCGQFVFTSHNITHLNLSIFMKEQMFIVGKDKRSLESSIYSLGEFKEIRYDSNLKIYEYYLSGLLGGVDNA